MHEKGFSSQYEAIILDQGVGSSRAGSWRTCVVEYQNGTPSIWTRWVLRAALSAIVSSRDDEPKERTEILEKE